VLPARSLEYFLSTPHWLDAFPPPREPHLERLSTHIESILNGSAAAVTPAVPRNQLLSLDVTEMEPRANSSSMPAATTGISPGSTATTRHSDHSPRQTCG